ncbi:MAG: sugar-binding protein [Bacteroidota bacterium]
MNKLNLIKQNILLLPLITLGLIVTISVMACNKKDGDKEELLMEVKSKAFTPGIRIAWDFSTLQQVSDEFTPNAYNGYGRIKQLNDKSLLAIYESSGNIMVRKSLDYGKKWGNTILVAERQDGTNIAVPDLLELKDGSLLAMYNPRPYNINPVRKFGIRIKKSYDKGLTWKEEQLLYEAGYEFTNGCWEPAALQLPNGEIQLFFANEGPYTTSDEQNISLLRSADNGKTWTKNPEIVSFRAGKRDGMPAPILLQDNATIVLTIEDNGFGNFKPYTIRNSITENWANTVTATSDKRHYALADIIAEELTAGAPYLAQLKTGETILSYQGTEGRTNNMEQAEMKVAIGDVNAKSFGRKSIPFAIATNKSALWSSVSVLDDNSVVAVTSTSNYSTSNRTEVWMIRGYVIPEINADKKTINVDGNTTEDAWNSSFPIFTGHTTKSQVRTKVIYDDNNLYVISRVKDDQIINGTSNENSDGITICLDPHNKSYERPHTGVYSFAVTSNGKIAFKEGMNSKWQTSQTFEGLKATSKPVDGGYLQEVAVPWTLIGGKPAINSRIGINVRLTELKAANGAVMNEDAAGCNATEPYTWLSLFLK